MGNQRRTQRIAFGAMVVVALVVPGIVPLPQAYGTPPGVEAQDTSASMPGQDATADTISNFVFQPNSLQITAGTTVTWKNSDGTAHTVTSDDGAFDSGSLAPGASFTQVFTTPGTYTYHCQIHPFMTATIIVS